MTIREIVEEWAGQKEDIIKVEDLVFELEEAANRDRASVLLEAAKAVCWMCHENKHELIVGQDGNYWHKTDWLTRCHAQAIHTMIAAGRGQGQTEGSGVSNE